ncbi:DUF4294 domain-containing protein [Marinilabilia salmonicolor]|jgi:hypothetical protein|uniref:Uncharacterized protein DUF4294 n=1 Tax=Marinilabilia salmonicolor TaxID=989 RepID=A0A2T0XA93_9BACT|nr:DUF4294 domain-containing protein [Marinilabilia salmonicolor]PRY95804.1 uncharacterized protein DUF4294 [Marinilabilia salmonicolor]RCW36580.1 uncharacterized protein DUF4294 [Marinilabilia salmonicolor]
MVDWRRYFVLATLILVLVTSGFAQNVRTEEMAGKEVYLLESEIVKGDTIPHIVLREVKVVPDWKFRNKRERRTYNRLVKNIKIALPYARVAAHKLNSINAELALIEREKERKEFLKEAEKELFNEFEKPLRKLTFSQGRMLIKLIDRETGDTSYNLIKEYKGGFSAFFWQSVARLFGSNLKDEYDGEREDRMIEHIIIMIDNGML